MNVLLSYWWTVPALLFGGWVLLNLKTSRPDGTLVKTHPFRTMMTHIMRTRNESVVYFDSYVRAENLLAYVEEARKRFACDITHCLVGGAAAALSISPKMNRFVVGNRLYQRNGEWLTFSMKRKRLDREAKLSTVKLPTHEIDTFETLCRKINEKIGVERSEAKTYTDKELSLFLRLPRPMLRWTVNIARWLDHHNLLPGAFMRGDPMYTSIFVANLGSVNMGAGFHHLYEWGNCPLFIMAGKIEERPVNENGQIVLGKVLHIRFSYDERIDDGLNAGFGIAALVRVLENPHTYLGCVKEDGSDRLPLRLRDAEELVASGKPATDTSVAA